MFRRISELETIEIQSKQEISRLREISEVATYQVGAINDMKVLDEKEFQSLRLQLLDLQSKSDDKTEIGNKQKKKTFRKTKYLFILKVNFIVIFLLYK